MPYLNITCYGTVVGWTAAGVIVSGRRDNNPRIQLWRQSTSATYAVAAEIPLLRCDGGTPRRVGANLYECGSVSGVDVKPGDALGVHLTASRSNFDQFRVYFDAGTTELSQHSAYHISGDPTTVSLTLSNTANIPMLPLVALRVLATGTYIYTHPLNFHSNWGKDLSVDVDIRIYISVVRCSKIAHFTIARGFVPCTNALQSPCIYSWCFGAYNRTSA